MFKGYAWCFSAKFWQLGYRMYCNTEYIAVGFDTLRSTIGGVLCEIFLNMFQWLLIAYNQIDVVDGYGKNKQYAITSQDVRSKSFQEPILNHCL